MKPAAISAISHSQPVTSASALSSTTPPATSRAETSSTGSGNDKSAIDRTLSTTLVNLAARLGSDPNAKPPESEPERVHDRRQTPINQGRGGGATWLRVWGLTLNVRP